MNKLFALPLAAFLIVRMLSAQETPTERQAARDMIAQLNQLEHSLDIQALVAKLTAPNKERDKVVGRAKELMDTEMLALGDQITHDPEIGFKEDRAVRVLTQRLRKYGFEPEVGVADLRTAFVAKSRFANSWMMLQERPRFPPAPRSKSTTTAVCATVFPWRP
jgi:hypothetical protein